MLEGNTPYYPSLDNFIPSMAIQLFLAHSKRILVIGDAWGREYRLLTALGKDVFALDIASNQIIPNLVQQSITDRTPFEDGFFDGVVLAEVLEHLFEDHVALQEIHRILRDDGILVITVPYLSHGQDKPSYHVRVHSRLTKERLLGYCGFYVEEHFYRGLVHWLPHNFITRRLLAVFRNALILIGDGDLATYRRVCFFTERWIGSTSCLWGIQKMFESYGGIMKARKGKKIDFAQINIDKFSDLASV
jgi:SAM-dependent methyltransferase